MKFLILIILFFVALFIFIPTIIVGIIRFFLSMLGGGSSSYRTRSDERTSRVESDYSTFRRPEASDNGSRKKVFDKNEGEYVNFEEIDKPSEPDRK